MPNLKLESMYLVLALVVPGLIILFFRSQFLTGRIPSHSDALLSYITVSVIYYALILPFLDLSLEIQQPAKAKILGWLAIIFLGPTVLGVLLGVNAQKGVMRRFVRWCGLNPLHVVPTAWDWKFGDMREQWVLVTLKDDTRYAGYCGMASFMSSDPKERDIYIEKIYEIGDDLKWTSRGENGVLIVAGEIRTIEFWPVTQRGDAP